VRCIGQKSQRIMFGFGLLAMRKKLSAYAKRTVCALGFALP
jgi:hypothetical protein